MAERTPHTLVNLDRLSRDPLDVRESDRAEGLAGLPHSRRPDGRGRQHRRTAAG